MDFLSFEIDLKAGPEGVLTGHASVFGSRDLGGDIVQAGDFKGAPASVPMLWMHRPAEPIGVARVAEDAKGLAFTASLTLEDPAAQIALAHVQKGSVRGVSIGYEV